MKSIMQDWQLWCRLCGDKDTEKHIDLFPTDDNGAVLGDTKLLISDVIEKHLALRITVDDYLPKMLCLQCYAFLSMIVDINESITKVQKTFQDIYETSMEVAAAKQLYEEDLIEQDEEILDSSIILEDPEFDIHCKYCGEHFQYIRSYREHLKECHENNDDKTLKLECLLCGDISGTSKDFRKHILTHEKDKRDETSSECVISDEKRYLKERVLCPQCKQYFASKKSLKTHLRNIHGRKQENGKQKVKRPVKQEQFICEECGAVLRNKVNLTIHMQRHSDEAPYECEVCKKRFKNPRRLKIHSETHSSHKHICPVCGLQLNAKNTLRRHRLVHSNERKHKCDYCGRGFKTSDGLKSHLMAHAGIKPYACNFCDRAFSCAVNCRLHKRSKHPKEWAASEASGGAQQIVHKIPSLETLKSLIKSASGGLNPVTKYKRKENIG